MPCVGVAIIFFGLGLITSVIFYAWLDEREDGFCNVVIPDTQVTTIEWSLRKQSIPDTYAVQPNRKITRGHLGHFDHRARQRCAQWMAAVHHTTVPPLK